MRLPALTVASLLTLSLAAQDDQHARWRIALGLGAGVLDFDEEDTVRNDEETAGAFRVGFEGVSRAGFGGGLRLESFAASDMQLGTGTDAPTHESAIALLERPAFTMASASVLGR